MVKKNQDSGNPGAIEALSGFCMQALYLKTRDRFYYSTMAAILTFLTIFCEHPYKRPQHWFFLVFQVPTTLNAAYLSEIT